jgi:hypothetical protein
MRCFHIWHLLLALALQINVFAFLLINVFALFRRRIPQTDDSIFPQPETIYESFTSDLKAFFDSVDGRVKLIHETFNQIGWPAQLFLYV